MRYAICARTSDPYGLPYENPHVTQFRVASSHFSTEGTEGHKDVMSQLTSNSNFFIAAPHPPFAVPHPIKKIIINFSAPRA